MPCYASMRLSQSDLVPGTGQENDMKEIVKAWCVAAFRRQQLAKQATRIPQRLQDTISLRTPTSGILTPRNFSFLLVILPTNLYTSSPKSVYGGRSGSLSRPRGIRHVGIIAEARGCDGY